MLKAACVWSKKEVMETWMTKNSGSASRSKLGLSQVLSGVGALLQAFCSQRPGIIST